MVHTKMFLKTTPGKLLIFSISKIRQRGIQRTYTMPYFSQMGHVEKMVIQKMFLLKRKPWEKFVHS
jgi:hypothetical protein